MEVAVRRRTLRLITNGMYILTARHGEHFGAATVTWLSQASFRPPLLMAAVRPESNVFKCLSGSGAAAVHVVGVGQQDVALKFFAPTQAHDGRINDEPFRPGTTGAPILDRLGAWVECRVAGVYSTGGDHALVVMEVVNAHSQSDVQPLTIAGSPWVYGG